jgi:complex III assembly factor LYRM7
MALVAYRNLLRSARIAFEGKSPHLSDQFRRSHSIGDMNTLFAARAEARKKFESNRDLRIGSEELQQSLVHAEEVAKFLRENVVQGQAADKEDNFSTLAQLWYSNQMAKIGRAADTRAHRKRRQRGYQERKGKNYIGRHQMLFLLGFYPHQINHDTRTVPNADPMQEMQT